MHTLGTPESTTEALGGYLDVTGGKEIDTHILEPQVSCTSKAEYMESFKATTLTRVTEKMAKWKVSPSLFRTKRNLLFLQIKFLMERSAL